ncbi:MAG: CoA binding protein [Dehalococcoidales bacterium]|nr:CoA binding protein [Dehalococcoidales bacterium]
MVGASNALDKWGATIFTRVLTCPSLQGHLYPINPNAREVQGVKAYPTVVDVPEPVDLAVIAVPLPGLLDVVKDCVRKGVKAGIIITAGLAETGSDGAELQEEIVQVARAGGMRFTGPNCNGHFNMSIDLSTLRLEAPVERGAIGVISQSGGFGGHILMCGADMGAGFSKFISVGNEADLHFEDVLEYYGQDSDTKVITGYIEGLRKGKDFFRLAREITRRKPMVVVKVGKTDAGAQAARSHTSAIAGSDLIYDAMFKQAGVIRVETVEELFDTAAALLRQPLPKGNRVGILSSGGGFACVTSDACARLGLEIAPLSPTTIERLNMVLPPRWPHANPVDTVATGFVTYPCLWPLIEDNNLDAVLVVDGIGRSMRDSTRSKQANSPSNSPGAEIHLAQQEELRELDKLFDHIDKYRKPVIMTSFVTPALRSSPVFAKLKEHGILIQPTPERAARVLSHLVEYSRYLSHASPDK